MIVESLTMLRSADLPPVSEEFFKHERVTSKKHRQFSEGTVVCLERHYHGRNTSNPEGMWGYVYSSEHGATYVQWRSGVKNVYLGGELCTLEEFMSEHGNVLPFSWRQ